jgi:hypothetical protein
LSRRSRPSPRLSGMRTASRCPCSLHICCSPALYTLLCATSCGTAVWDKIFCFNIDLSACQVPPPCWLLASTATQAKLAYALPFHQSSICDMESCSVKQHLSKVCSMNFQGLDLSVKNFLTSVPLVADLRSPAMRERHWTQLMTTTKVRCNAAKQISPLRTHFFAVNCALFT